MTGLSPALVGAAVGALAAGGTLLVAAWWSARRPSLDARLAPYLRAPGHGHGPSGPGPVPPTLLGRLLGPTLQDAARHLARWGPGSSETRRRLDRAGASRTVEDYRAEQAAWTVAGLGLGVLIGVALLTSGSTSPPGALLLAVSASVAAHAGRDQLLLRQVRARERRLSAELPTVAELLALAVAAGESPVAALDRVARTTRGEMAHEVGRVVADVRAGRPLGLALEDLADRSGLPALTRLAEAIATAVERGTPLADVLRAQAQDVREAGRRGLMEDGGRREVAMLVPVVLLILPVTVVFALLPGLAALRLGP